MIREVLVNIQRVVDRGNQFDRVHKLLEPWVPVLLIMLVDVQLTHEGRTELYILIRVGDNVHKPLESSVV